MQVFVSAVPAPQQQSGRDSQPAIHDDAGTSKRLVVADAFAGNIAVINPPRGVIESVRALPAHNIRGMAISADGERVLVSHQVLSPLARADFDDVHWGNLMQNVVRDLSLASILDADADLLAGSRVTRLGDVGNGAADPAGLAVVPGVHSTEGVLPVSSSWLQALSGVGEVAIDTGTARLRLSVGSRPIDIAWDEKRRVAYVVCMLDDTIAVVDLDAADVIAHITLGPRPQPTPRDRGERLFFDGRRSHDGWLSCHSCHTDGHTNGGLADTLGDESYGTAKKIPSLLGVRDTNPWGWNGRFRELHAQVTASFTSTMHGTAPTAYETADVVAFLHTLRPPPAVDDGMQSDAVRDRIEQGRRLFAGLSCRSCHVPPLTYTIDGVFDAGIRDEAGLSEFNPPSLRGVSQRASFFHDGRAPTLEAVFTDHAHQLPRELAGDELQSLLAFLRSL
jgi:cytochrome c peroxidase